MNEVTREFVHLFNAEKDFYECHEIFEAAWKAAEDPLEAKFYKALVQVATAQFKLDKGLYRGVKKLHSYCKDTLALLPDVYMGIDIDSLRRDFTNQVQSLPEGVEVDEPGAFVSYGLAFLTIQTVF